MLIFPKNYHYSSILQYSTIFLNFLLIALFGSNQDDEDCLSINVYSPNLNRRSPVMVWIYGGGFSSGSGNSFIYGPNFFVSEGVVLVTMNYRVGPLGFLSTGDENAPGNYGMKDVILSLKWVQVLNTNQYSQI